jgi:MinD-like ATPase involved in chromosome partitioning or flagellar assembly
MSLFSITAEKALEGFEPENPKPALRASLASSGKVVACWGSAGSGKSMVALNLGFQIAKTGSRVLLIDLDTRRPCLSAALGIVDPGAGVTALTRLSRQGRLEIEDVERLSHQMKFGNDKIDFLPGLNLISRFDEIGDSEIRDLLKLAREHYEFVILDLSDELSREEISITTATLRNQAQLTALDDSEIVLGIFNADQVGVNRFLLDYREASVEIWPVANRVRASVLGRNPERQIRDAIYRSTKAQIRFMLPDDAANVDMALSQAKPLCMLSKSSKLGEALRLMAMELMES